MTTMVDEEIAVITFYEQGPPGPGGAPGHGLVVSPPGTVNVGAGPGIAVTDHAVGIADAGVGTTQLGDASVTPTKLASAVQELVEDWVAQLLVAGPHVSLDYNDSGGTLTIAVAGLTAADLSDFAAAAYSVVAGTLRNSPSLAFTATGGTIHADVLDSPTVGGATPAQLRDRSTHTGTQDVSTVTGVDERVQDIVGGMLVAGSLVTVAYDDPAGTVTISVAGIQASDVAGLGEAAQDAVGAALLDSSTVHFTYDDVGGTISGAVKAASIAGGAGAGHIIPGSILGTDLAAATLTDAEVSATNKDGAANVPSLRTLGTGPLQGAAGNDVRFSDQRTPPDGSVTLTKLAFDPVELAQDAVGMIVGDTATLDLTYSDGTPSITGAVLDSPKLEGHDLSYVLDRANQHGTQHASTIDDFAAAVTAVPLNALRPNGTVDLNHFGITNLDPPVSDPNEQRRFDAVTTGMLYDRTNASDYKPSVRVASTTNVNIASPGAEIDGVSLGGTWNPRVLLVDQTDPTQNGIYDYVAPALPMVRSLDAAGAPTANVTPGLTVMVEEGTHAGTRWILQGPGPLDVGSNALVFVEDSGLSQLTVGDSLTLTGHRLDANFGVIGRVGVAGTARIYLVQGASDLNSGREDGSPKGTMAAALAALPSDEGGEIVFAGQHVLDNLDLNGRNAMMTGRGRRVSRLTVPPGGNALLLGGSWPGGGTAHFAIRHAQLVGNGAGSTFLNTVGSSFTEGAIELFDLDVNHWGATAFKFAPSVNFVHASHIYGFQNVTLFDFGRFVDFDIFRLENVEPQGGYQIIMTGGSSGRLHHSIMAYGTGGSGTLEDVLIRPAASNDGGLVIEYVKFGGEDDVVGRRKIRCYAAGHPEYLVPSVKIKNSKFYAGATAGQTAMRLDQPIVGWDVADNEFHGFALLCDDAQRQGLAGIDNGKSKWDNKVYPSPTSPVCHTFSNNGRGFHTLNHDGTDREIIRLGRPRSIETGDIHNLIPNSSDLTTWARSAGVTVNPAPDPEGGGAAWQIMRDGAVGSQSVATPFSTVYSHAIFQFQAIAAGLSTLYVAHFDISDGLVVTEIPFQLTPGAWQPFSLFLPEVNPSHSHQLLILPGSWAAMAGDVWIYQPQLCYFPCDYRPTTGAAGTSPLGTKFQRAVGFAGKVGFGGKPAVPSDVGWAAATGTATKSTFDTASVTLPQLAERVKALTDFLILRGDIGT